MSGDPWFKFFPSDWIAGVSGLSAAERGVYVTLLAVMYDRGGPIPRDDARLARMCGLPKVGFSRAVEALLEVGKLVEESGLLFNERAKKQLTERENRTLTAKEAAQSRWEKSKENQSSKNADALQEQCEPNATRARIPEARYQSTDQLEILDKNKDTGIHATPPSATPREILSEHLSPQTVADVIEHRKAKRAKLTARAAKELIREMLAFGDPERAAAEMISRGWTGFKAEWMQTRQPRAGPLSANGAADVLREMRERQQELTNGTGNQPALVLGGR